MSLNKCSRKSCNFLYDKCEDLLNYHVILRMKDDSIFDGIIVDLDEDNIVVLVGEDVFYDDKCNGRRPRRRYRRFRRRRFPLLALAAISLLPYHYYYPY